MEQSERSKPGSRATLVSVLAIGAALAAMVLAGPLAPGAAAAAEDGGAVFGQLCQGCHTIGGGASVGPDLEGVADRRERAWVERFILEPDVVIASGDPIAKELLDQYGAPMPNLGVTPAQAEALLTYLGFAAQTETTPTETTPTETTPTETTPTTTTPTETTPTEPAPSAGDAARGKDLFTGATRLDAGGPSCLSCHAVAGAGSLGGGRLGPDLTGSFAKFGGAQGLDATLETVPFPTMLPIFSRNPLTAQERADLVAFLATAPDRQRPASAAGKLMGFSVIVAVAIGLLAMIVWRRRLRGVRKPLVNRSRGK